MLTSNIKHDFFSNILKREKRLNIKKNLCNSKIQSKIATNNEYWAKKSVHLNYAISRKMLQKTFYWQMFAPGAKCAIALLLNPNF